ncbi:DUF4390 domain-containing protein [Limnohabitans sp. INBF002]|uniref:DUF4390 domain-containing protein n=1 Tax=Limnohabitans sp. INBF002 TaxID=2986280 RepID=UPI002377BB82|nr:DUF4390 domain-containing protein [Limnohabitans sp. INBF002]BDU54112.1 hypothetical protein LINBF2_23470 [Limnohabitans sp. INBF002]
MTAFITHCWKNFLRLDLPFSGGVKRVRSLCAAVLAVCCLAFAGVAQADTPVDLQGLQLERQEAGLYMSGQWRFDLPPALEDALLKGITLYFVTEVEINQERWYFYNQRVARAERHVRLFYQPLTRRWRVNISPQAFNQSGLGVSLGQSYDTAEEAMSAVRRIIQWRIANATDVASDAKQTISINFKLDLKQLPRPLQIGAAGQSDWNIGFSKTQRLELAP